MKVVYAIVTLGCANAWALPGCFGSSSDGAPDSGTWFDGGTTGDSSTRDAGGAVADSGGSDGDMPDGKGPNVATMFVPDQMAGAVYRYSVTPNADPVFGARFSVPSAISVALGPTGELFVTSFSNKTIYRFLSPFDALTPNGTITGVGLSGSVEGSTFVDDQLWVDDYGGSNIVELAFDAQGMASVAGTMSVFEPMDLFWDSTSRVLYVSEPSQTLSQVQDSGAPPRTVQHYQVSSGHTATALAPIAVPNPYGVIVAPWGELLVANSTGTSLSRFSIDAQGSASANGTISGNGLSYPLALAFTPWGELFVGNQGTGTISRFTFDSSHDAVPNGTFQTRAGPDPNGVGGGSGLDWVAVFPGSSTVAGGVTDSGVSSDAGSD